MEKPCNLGVPQLSNEMQLSIMNMVKRGELRVEDAIQQARKNNLELFQEKEKQATQYNFSVHKFNRYRWQKRILQVDFNSKMVCSIEKGIVKRKLPFAIVKNCHDGSGTRFSISFKARHDYELEATSLQEKQKILQLVSQIIQSNIYSQAAEHPEEPYGATPAPERLRQGPLLLQKGGLASFKWKRYEAHLHAGQLTLLPSGGGQPRDVSDTVVTSSTLPIIIHFSDGKARVQPSTSTDAFTLLTQCSTYQFRVPTTSVQQTTEKVQEERDSWVTAIDRLCEKWKRSSQSEPIYAELKELRQSRPVSGLFSQAVGATLSDALLPLKEVVSDPMVPPNEATSDPPSRSLKEMTSDPPRASKEVTSEPQLHSKQVTSETALCSKEVATPDPPRPSKEVVYDVLPLPRKMASDPLLPSREGTSGLVPQSKEIMSDTLLLSKEVTSNPLSPSKEMMSEPLLPSKEVTSNPVSPTAIYDELVLTNTVVSGPMAPSKGVLSSDTLYDNKAEATVPNNAKSPHLPISTPLVRPCSPVPLPTTPTRSPLPTTPTRSPLQPVYVSPPPPPAPPPPLLPWRRMLPKKRTKAFHWDLVAQDKIDKSFWAHGINGRVVKIDTDRLYSQFKVKALEKLTESLDSSHHVEIMLNQKIAHNFNIFLKSFPVQPEELQEKLFIINEEDGGLSDEQIASLRRYVPTVDDVEMYKSYKGPVSDLHIVDQYMLAMCHISYLSPRLDLLLILRELPITMEDLEPLIDQMIQVCHKLVNSQSFVCVLEYLLAVGNYLNEHAGKDKAKGFRLSSLTKLSQLRGAERHVTLLHALVEQIVLHEPGLATFPSELAEFDTVPGASIKGLTAEIDVVKNELQKVQQYRKTYKKKNPISHHLKFSKDLKTAIERYNADLQRLTKKSAEMRKIYADILVKFGEAADQDSQELFGWVCHFITEFKKVHAELSR
ncbi:uncharacterized protein LOC134457323 [Engraulis encrasicolus]|uniref:uncharacterized protein LOC134457323 n=1 Tax=Engraulis encrasicolus TaxID=184585 RepID=UPI002FD3DE47